MIPTAAILISVGALLTYWCRKELVLAWSSRRWPQTKGHISGSIVLGGFSNGLATDGTFSPVDRPWREFRWVFTYTVSGCIYQSSQFSFSYLGWLEVTRHYDEGDEVTVYYCPATPSIAVLQPGLQGGALITGPFMVALGLCFLAYGICTR